MPFKGLNFKITDMSEKIGKILFLTIDFPPAGGGMSRHCYDMATALKKSGEEVIIFAPGVKHQDRTNLAVRRLRCLDSGRVFDNYFWSIFVFLWQGFFYCLTHRVKAVLVHTWSPAGVAAFILNKLSGIPYFIFAHGLDIYSCFNDNKVKKLMTKVLGNSRAVIANSNFTKILVQKIGPDIQAVVLNPVIDLKRFANISSPPQNTLAGKKVILTVARLVESKNHESVIRAMPRVIERFPEAVYRIVGDGPLGQKLKSLAVDLGVKDKVVFEGEAAEEDLPAYYSNCDIFILASKEIPRRGEAEGFGIVFLEAAACSKPAIGGKSGGIPDAVLDGETGILVDPTDVDNIAAAIIRLLSSDVLRKELGSNARRRVEEELNSDKLSQRIKDIIDVGLDK